MNRRGWGRSKPLLGKTINWSHPLSKGLVGCWLLDAGGGLKEKDYTNLNNGTISGPTWGLGNNLTFAGAGGSGNVTTGNIGLNNLHQNKMSIVLWYKITTETDLMRFLNKGSDGAGPGSGWIILYISSTDSITFNVRWSGAEASWRISPITPGLWVQLSITYDGTSSSNTPSIYLNGISQAVTTGVSPSGSNNTDDSALNLIIGNRETTKNRAFSGILSNVMIYNRILLDREIKKLYEQPYCFFSTPRRRNIFQHTATSLARYMYCSSTSPDVLDTVYANELVLRMTSA